jgi:hypothetical protein
VGAFENYRNRRICRSIDARKNRQKCRASCCRKYWKALTAGSAGVVSCFSPFYLCTAFALAQGTGPPHYPRTGFMVAQLAANLMLAAGIIYAAIWSDCSARPRYWRGRDAGRGDRRFIGLARLRAA